MPLLPGSPAPMFSARTHSRPNFASGSLGGIFVLLVFLPRDEVQRKRALSELQANRTLFDDVNRAAF